MAFRSPVVDAPPRSVRWDRDRFFFEQERDRTDRENPDREDREDRDREGRDREDRRSDRRSDYGEVRDRFVEADDHVYSSRDSRRGSAPGGSVARERSVDRFEQDRIRTRRGDEIIREREQRRVFYDDEPSLRSPRLARRPPPPQETEFDRKMVMEKERERFRPRSPSPPARPPPPLETELDRTMVIEKERERFRHRSPSPPARPGRPGPVIRRQSSLDVFDRKRYHEVDNYSPVSSAGPPLPPLRRDRDDYRLPPYQPIPLPRHKALPPPRVYAERDYEQDFDEISVVDPHRYGDEEPHHRAFAPPSLSLPPPERERILEREIIRTRRRDRSRESRSTHRSRATATRSSSTSSNSSSSVRAPTVKDQYPKKGKTRIPQRLVSKRALIDLGYPFVEEGATIVVQMALGQDNIDDLLRLSQDYKKSELEVITARSPVREVDRRTEMVERTEIVRANPPSPSSKLMIGEPYIVPAAPAPVEEFIEKTTTTIMRDVSPARSHRSHRSHRSSSRHYRRRRSQSASSRRAYIIETSPREREMSAEMAVGPLALVEAPPHRELLTRHYHHRHRRDDSLPGGSSRSRSRSRHHRSWSRYYRSQSQHHRSQSRHHRSRSRYHRSQSRHHRHRSHSTIDMDREVIRAERLPTGELVLFEERIEKIEEPLRGTRIEKDRRGPPPKLMRAMLATLT